MLGDQASLHELASNLIENAVLYTPSGGNVTVRIINKTRPDQQRRSVMVVEDDGPGIAADERDRVFERFYRIVDSNVSGSGLGLAIVREIANVHQAEIYLGDGINHTGTSVTVEFPVANKVEQVVAHDFSPPINEKLLPAPVSHIVESKSSK